MSVSSEVELSRRQRQVLALYAAGNGRREISAVLFISERSVRRDLESAQERLGAQTLRQTIVLGFARGLISANDDGSVDAIF